MKKFNDYHEIDEHCECNDLFEGLVVEESEYQGKKVKLNDPIRTSENPNKKFKVYVKNDQGNVVVVRFGDPNMDIKRDDPKRRASFRARHDCANPSQMEGTILVMLPVAWWF